MVALVYSFHDRQATVMVLLMAMEAQGGCFGGDGCLTWSRLAPGSEFCREVKACSYCIETWAWKMGSIEMGAAWGPTLEVQKPDGTSKFRAMLVYSNVLRPSIVRHQQTGAWLG